MHAEMRTWSPDVSIIVLTFNSDKTIGICLDAILKLGYPREKLEVIVVDNGSMDATLEIVRNYGVKYYVRPGAKIAQLRNFGAEQAKGDVLAFVDSDCQVDPNWLTAALKHLAEAGVGVVGCSYDIPKDSHWMEKAWSTSYNQETRNVNFVPAGNMVLRREVFEKARGFNEELETGEDTDLCARVIKNGYEVLSDPGIRSIHWGNPKTSAAFVKKEIWYGKGMVRLLRDRNFSNKVFLLTNAFILAHAVILVSIFLPLAFTAKLFIILFSVLSVLSISALSALHRCAKANCYAYFPHLTFLWYLYFLGRGISMVRIYLSFIPRKRKAFLPTIE